MSNGSEAPITPQAPESLPASYSSPTASHPERPSSSGGSQSASSVPPAAVPPTSGGVLPEQQAGRVGRGKYVRKNGCGIRRGWEAAAQNHMQRIFSGDMLYESVSCLKVCSFGGQCIQTVFTVLLLRQCAAQTFDDKTLREERTSIPNHTACRNWFRFIYACRICDADRNVVSINFNSRGHRVCSGAFAATYAIPPATMKSMVKCMMGGNHEWVSFRETATSAANASKFSPLSVAKQWWAQRLLCYDFMPHREREIVYPVKPLASQKPLASASMLLLYECCVNSVCTWADVFQGRIS
eukprot:6202013-Pleurochrysis_carterae.AAC.1